MTPVTDNEAFVRQYQLVRGMTVDGWAGPATRNDLAKAFPATASPIGMKASSRAVALIHSFESFQPRAYKDPGSRDGLPITIGWGSTSDVNGNPVPLGAVWTRDQADAKFAQDLRKFEAGVASALNGSPVTHSQFDALVSFAYNIGIGALAKSTLIKKHNAGDYAGARAEFARWNKNDGKAMAGLTRRRSAEAAMYGGE